jgi:hypothetical protein
VRQWQYIVHGIPMYNVGTAKDWLEVRLYHHCGHRQILRESEEISDKFKSSTATMTYRWERRYLLEQMEKRYVYGSHRPRILRYSRELECQTTPHRTSRLTSTSRKRNQRTREKFYMEFQCKGRTRMKDWLAVRS